MKKLLLTCCLVSCSFFGHAQDRPLVTSADSIKSMFDYLFPKAKTDLTSNMNVEFYTSGAANFTDGKLDETAFKLNRVRMEVLGTLKKMFFYHFRQAFNNNTTPESLDNIASSIEYALIGWDTSDKFKLTFGKQFFALGGYEYYVSAISVREYSEFNNNSPAYLAGVSGTIELSPSQELIVQLLNSRNGSYEHTFAHGLPEGVGKSKAPLMATLNWNGSFVDKTIQLRYAAAWGQLAEKKNVYYLTAGNIYEKGPALAYVDVMYSNEDLDSKGIISRLQGAPVANPVTAENLGYFSVIANLDYRIHSHWNLYVKGAYETARVNKSNGPFEKGLYCTNWNLQACAEYLPIKNMDLKIFAHWLYKGHHLEQRAKALGAECPNTQRISLGVVYVMPVF